MKSILLLTVLAFAMCNRDLLVELEAKAKPLPVVKCLIASETIRKDVVVVVDAVKKFVEDKNAFVLITKLLAVYPEVEAEVKRCLKEDGVNLTSFVSQLPRAIYQLWKALPASVKQEILEAIARKGRQVARRVCNRVIKKKKDRKICSYI